MESMEIRRGYKFRIYPTEEQKETLEQIFGACRHVYNYYLDMQISAYSSAGISVPYADLSRDLTRYRNESDWMSHIQTRPLQASLRQLMTAYSRFFLGKSKLPKHKTKRGVQSFSKPKEWKFCDDRLMIQKNLKVKFRGRIPPATAEMRTLTVSKTPSGKYFAGISCVEVVNAEALNGGIGIDLGLSELAITSDGNKYNRPKLAQINSNKLRKLHQELSRKKKGSNNRTKARQKVARLYEKLANQRLDNLHKTSHGIISGNYELVAVEDLAVANMMKNRRLSKSIGDTGWNELIRQIEYKQAWKGGLTVKVDRFFPSSKQCSSCSVVITKLPLSVRHWQCENCGAKHDRDVNAAKNILKQAEVQLGVEKEALASNSETTSVKHGQVKLMPTMNSKLRGSATKETSNES